MVDEQGRVGALRERGRGISPDFVGWPWLAEGCLGVGRPEKVAFCYQRVEEVFLNSPGSARGPWLSFAQRPLTERKGGGGIGRKRSEAETPVWLIGSALTESDQYAQAFSTIGQTAGEVNSRIRRDQDRAGFRAARIAGRRRCFVEHDGELLSLEAGRSSGVSAALCC